MANGKVFETPVELVGETGAVGSVEQALLILSSVDWPGERTDTHATAVETCLKVLDGHRSTVDARDRFVEAAREAGLLPS